MESTSPPKRIVLCRGPYCNMDRRADKLYDRLAEHLAEINGDEYPPPIKLTTANCLDMCGAAPNMVLYPGGVAFHGLDLEKLDAIVDANLR